MNKPILFFLLLLFLPSCLIGQEIIKSKGLKNKSNGFTKVVGENIDGVFVIHHKNHTLNGDFYIEKFDHDLAKSSINKILIPKATLENVIVQKHSISYLTQEGKRLKGEKIFRFTSMTSATYQRLSSSAIRFTNYNFSQESSLIHTRSDKMKTTFAAAVKNGKKSGLEIMQVLNNNDIQKVASINTQYGLNELSYIDIVNDAFNNTYILGLIKSGFQKAPQYVLFMHNSISGEVIEKKLNNDKTHLSSVSMNYDELNKRMNLFSFYGDALNQNKGYMFVSYGGSDNQRLEVAFKDFDSEFKEELLGVNRTNNGSQLSNFHVKGFKSKENGGIVIIAEKFESINKTEIQFVNGVAQPMTRTVYNFDDVIILSIDSKGEIEWNRKINKKQNTMYDGGFYSSIQVVFTEYNMYVLYNDKMNTSGNVMQYKIDLNGEVTEEVIMKSVNYYQYIIPVQGGQIGYNRVAIPSTINRTTKLLKFIYN